MTKEYQAYLAYRKAVNNEEKQEDFLIHYGVKGQKWGTRQWQNVDGTYTEAGKHHYGWGYGRRTTVGVSPNTQSSVPKTTGMPNVYRTARPRRAGTGTVSERQAVKRQRKPTQAEIEERKARTRRIIGIAAGVAVAAALTYAAYRGSTKLRDNMRSDMLGMFNTDPNKVHTLHSKYWDAADRKHYSTLTAERAKNITDNFTRRDALATKLYEKTGVRVNVPQSRKRVLEQRTSEINYSNFIRDAEKRGHMNKTIHDARAELHAAQKKLNSYRNTSHIGISKQYETYWDTKYSEGVEAARRRLNGLLSMRRAG